MFSSKTSSIKSFTDLTTWQHGHKLVLSVYKYTKSLPSEEKFGLINQMQRAAVSITSNIAEGFGRQSAKEQTQFFYLSLGSLKELQNLVLICQDLGYLTKDEIKTLIEESANVSRLLNGLIKSSKKRN